MKNKQLLGNFILLLTAFIWGTAFVAQRVGMELIEPITFNAARMALAAVAVGFVDFLFGLKEKSEPDKRTPAQQKERDRNTLLGGIGCGLFLSIASVFQQMGIVYTTAGKAGFITAMYMLLVPVIGFVYFKKKNTWLVWLSVVIGIAGMYYLCITEDFSLAYGDMLVSLCALFFSGHILCCDYFAPKANPIRMSAIQFATATVTSTVVAAIVEEPSVEKLISAIVPIVYCGLMSGGLGYTLQIIGQRLTEPTVASLIMSMESVFAVLAGVVLLHEKMTPREITGCLLLFAAIVLVQIRLPGRKRKPA